jgi:hypothetical protein
MWTTESRVLVAAPQHQVFAYLSDFRRHNEWSLAVAEIEQTSGDGIGVGAEFVAHETVPMKFTSFSRITRLDAPSVIEWSAWDNRTFRVEWSFELSREQGATLVVQRAGVQPTSFPGKVLLNVMRRRQIPRENERSLQRLKAILEAPLAVPTGSGLRAAP